MPVRKYGRNFAIPCGRLAGGHVVKKLQRILSYPHSFTLFSGDGLQKAWENVTMSRTLIRNVGQVDELLTKHELAKKLKCTRRSIDNYVAQGLIPKIKVGKLSRFNWAHVCAALEGKGK